MGLTILNKIFKMELSESSTDEWKKSNIHKNQNILATLAKRPKLPLMNY